MSVENDPGFWKWFAGMILGGVGAAFGAWKFFDAKLELKADKTEVQDAITEMREEITLQRQHVAKIFDQMRENEQRSQDRYERLMERLSGGSAR
jgi:hypothetical protein